MHNANLDNAKKHNAKEIVKMSPFKYGCTVSDEFFCPRPELEKRLFEHIRSGQHVAVVGPRRTGKSSLVLETVRRAKGFALYHVDFLDVRSRAELCKRMVTALSRLESSDSWLSRMMRMLVRLRPTLSIDPRDGSPTVSIDTKEAAALGSLDCILDALVAQTARRKVCVVFDEFQDIMDTEDGENVLAILRSRIQLDSNTPYIFLGSVRHRMLDIFLDSHSPFYHGAALFEVGNIAADDFYSFLRRRFATGRRAFPREAFDAIAMSVHNTPGYIQEVCDALWQASNAGDAISAADIGKAIDVIFAREGEHFSFAIRQLTAIQVQVLTAISVRGGREIYSGDFLAAAGMRSTASVKRALSRLIEEGLVYFAGGEYRIDNPFFAEWVKRR